MSVEKLLEPINKAMDFITDIIKPPIKEISEILTDKVKYWRFQNQIKILERAQEYIKSKGYKPNQIPVKTLVPLLDGASLEEDEDMQDRWAALLANAANPNNVFSSHIIFVELLKQLSPYECIILERMYAGSFLRSSNDLPFFKRIDLIRGLSIVYKDGNLLIENLLRLSLIEISGAELATNYDTVDDLMGTDGIYELKIDKDKIKLTTLSVELIRICTLDQ